MIVSKDASNLYHNSIHPKFKEKIIMKTISCLMMLAAVTGLLVLSCGETPNPLQVPLTQENGASSPAKAEPINSKVTESFPFEYFDECTGEYVLFDVKVTTTEHYCIDGNGGFHGHFLQQWHCTGVGETSGIEYVGPQTDHGDSYEGSNGDFIGTYTENWVIISRGKADNLRGHVLSHITINANGEVTTEILKMTFECKG
jgi:hypothetical protein